jgi:hypothetical protein
LQRDGRRQRVGHRDGAALRRACIAHDQGVDQRLTSPHGVGRVGHGDRQVGPAGPLHGPGDGMPAVGRTGGRGADDHARIVDVIGVGLGARGQHTEVDVLAIAPQHGDGGHRPGARGGADDVAAVVDACHRARVATLRHRQHRRHRRACPPDHRSATVAGADDVAMVVDVPGIAGVLAGQGLQACELAVAVDEGLDAAAGRVGQVADHVTAVVDARALGLACAGRQAQVAEHEAVLPRHRSPVHRGDSEAGRAGALPGGIDVVGAAGAVVELARRGGCPPHVAGDLAVDHMAADRMPVHVPAVRVPGNAFERAYHGAVQPDRADGRATWRQAFANDFARGVDGMRLRPAR